MQERLNHQGRLVLVHWRPAIADCALSGDEVHAIAAARLGDRLDLLRSRLTAEYRLDLYARP
jgi:hypothetical protein